MAWLRASVSASTSASDLRNAPASAGSVAAAPLSSARSSRAWARPAWRRSRHQGREFVANGLGAEAGAALAFGETPGAAVDPVERVDGFDGSLHRIVEAARDLVRTFTGAA